MFWIKGSCGDIVQQLLSTNDQISTGFSFATRDDGRVIRTISPDWQNYFPHNILHPLNLADKNFGWLSRTWSKAECDTLLNLAQDKIVIVGTHQIEQVAFLQQQLGSSVSTVGIVYNDYMEKFVKKNFFFKVINYDQITKDSYKKRDQRLYELAEQSNHVGVLALKDELRTPVKNFQSVDYHFDHTIDLGQLLTGNLQWASELVPSSCKHIFEQWLDKQNPLFTHKITASLRYQQCLGYNKSATKSLEQDIFLDIYDKIFINHYTKANNLPACKATTHAELIEFFEKL